MSKRILLTTILAWVFAAVAVAQPLADRVPDSAMVYFGWAPDASLQATAPAKMLADEQMRRPLIFILQQILEAMPATGGQPPEEIAALAGEASQCRAAVAILSPAGDVPTPRVLALIELGAKRAEFEKKFTPIQNRLKAHFGQGLQMMKLGDGFLWVRADAKDRPLMVWGFAGDWFIAYWGADAEAMLAEVVAANGPAKPLASSPAFKSAMDKLPGAAIVCSWSDGAKARALVEKTLVRPDRGMWHDLTPLWPGLLTELGMADLSSVVEKTTVDKGRLVTRARIALNHAPDGLLALLANPPVDEAVLNAIPADAMAAMAGRLDLAKTYAAIKASSVKIGGPDASRGFDQIEKTAESMGLPINDLLGPMGDQWVIYNAASTGGFAFTGWTLVGQVRDADRFGRSEEAIRGVLAEEFGRESGKVVDIQVDGVTIHTLVSHMGFIPFAPSWAVVGDRFVVALYPQMVEGAIRQLQLKGGDGIVANPAFAAVRQQVGAAGPMMYFAGDEAVRNVYPILLPVMTAIGGWNSDFNLGYVPSMQRLLRYVGPNLATLTATDDGYELTMAQTNPLLSPLTLLSPNAWLAVLVPAAAEMAAVDSREVSLSRLRQLGQGLMMYANDNKGKYPPNLTELVKTQDLGPETLLSVFPDGQEVTYLYFDGLKVTAKAEVILAYDPFALRQTGGAPVLFADGHCEWLDRAAFDRAVARSRQVEAKSCPAELMAK